jgi:hypothetical protein
MENRSFDHLLGHLGAPALGGFRGLSGISGLFLVPWVPPKRCSNHPRPRRVDRARACAGLNDTRINGVNTTISNPLNPADPSSKRVHVAFDAGACTARPGVCCRVCADVHTKTREAGLTVLAFLIAGSVVF